MSTHRSKGASTGIPGTGCCAPVVVSTHCVTPQSVVLGWSKSGPFLVQNHDIANRPHPDLMVLDVMKPWIS